MNTDYNLLINKLDAFIRKYYTNRLIRGVLYSIALLGSFFLVFTLLEAVAWFSSPVRTTLFYGYSIIGLFILGYFVVVPILKLIRAGKIISHEFAAEIIGQHFPEVKDKLLNVLQLNSLYLNNEGNRELVLASINQKANRLKPIPFVSAIDLTKNKKYLVYTLPPVLILLGILLTSPSTITAPGSRIINHSLAYEKPLPFTIHVENTELKAIQLEDFELKVSVKGGVLPEQLFITSNGAEYQMQKDGRLNFSYVFKKVQKSQVFTISTSGYETVDYELVVLPRPDILNFEAALKYPQYTGLPEEVIKNTGDFVVPQGTMVTWKFYTRDTRKLNFTVNNTLRELSSGKSNTFVTELRVMQPLTYTLSLSNEFLTGSDSMSFFVNVIPDVYPGINAEEYRDSIYDNRLYFKGNCL